MDSYSKLEDLCKKKKLRPIKIIGLKGKDFGIVRKDKKDDFKVIIYDLKNKNRVGSADFYIENTSRIKEFYHLNNADDKAYSSNFRIKKEYRGIGLSKILVDESINILEEIEKSHVAQFITPKGSERIKQQLLQHGYSIAIPNEKHYPTLIYKKHKANQ